MVVKRSEVIIRGIAGKFPLGKTLDDWWKDLLEGENIIGDMKDGPYGTYVIKEDFENELGEEGDPRVTFLANLAKVALMDAGISPESMRDSKIGVYTSVVKLGDRDKAVPDKLLADRISFKLGYKGPSLTLSSTTGFFALQCAVREIQLGKCDSAMVVTSCDLNDKNYSRDFAEFNYSIIQMMKGVVQGYLVYYITADKVPGLRNYASILHIDTEYHGPEEIPEDIYAEPDFDYSLRKTYKDARISPSSIDYVEVQGTGASVCDVEEIEIMNEVFCEGRDPSRPLWIGAGRKSNFPYDAIYSILRVILMNKNGLIPNSEPKRRAKPYPDYYEGAVRIVQKDTPWAHGTIVGVNSARDGDLTGHAIVKLTPPREEPEGSIPLLIPYTGNTQRHVYEYLDTLIDIEPKAGYAAVVHNVLKMDIPGHKFRGFVVLDYANPIIKVEEVPIKTVAPRPVWILFSGVGNSQRLDTIWRSIKNFELVSASIKRSAEVLQPKGLDLLNALESTSTDSNNRDYIVALVSIQVALADLLLSVGIQPDGYISQGLGEILCAYVDRRISQDKTLLVAKAIAENLASNGFDLEVAAESAKSELGAIVTDSQTRSAKWISSSVRKQSWGTKSDRFNADYIVSSLKRPEYLKAAIQGIPAGAVLLEIIGNSKNSFIRSLVNNSVRIVEIFGTGKDHVSQLLAAIGSRFNAGAVLDLTKLYPKVEIPISTGTPMYGAMVAINYNDNDEDAK